jgi:putative NADH-flavin reductase
MNVVVFDAAEPLGRLLVAGALGRAHVVTAFGAVTTAPADLERGGAGRLRAAPGDLLDGVAVAAAIAGQDAVLYAVEPSSVRGGAMRASQGVRHVVRAMSGGGARRLVCLSIGGPGTEPDGEPAGIVGRLLKAAPSQGALADLRHLEVTVRQSGLEWTIVRPARLIDAAGKHSWRAGPGYALPHGTKIARADVAEFMLDEVDDGANVGHAVAVAW